MCRVVIFFLMKSLAKDKKNHSQRVTVLSLNGHAHSDSQRQTRLPWLPGHRFSNHCVWCSLWGGAGCEVLTVGVVFLQSSHATAILEETGKEPYRKKPLTPTTKILFKMGEARWNLHHQKCPKAFEFTRTTCFLCQLKLKEWQLGSPDSPLPPLPLPNHTQHSTSGNCRL